MNRATRSHPQSEQHEAEADTLSPFRGVLAALEAVREAPPADREPAAAARRRFLNEAADLRAARARHPLRWAPQLRRTLVPIAVLLLLAVVSLTGLVAAAQSAWPATPLYPVKTTWEDLRLAMTASPQSRAELLVTLIAERVAEIERLSAAGRPIPEAVLQRLDLQMRHCLQAAAQLPESQMQPFLRRLLETTAIQSQALELALRGAPPQNRAAITRGLDLLAASQSWIALGIGDPPGFRQVGGSAASFPALLPPPPAATATPEPAGTPEPTLPAPGATPTPTPTALPTARPTRTPASPRPSPTGPVYTTLPPTHTPEPRETPLPAPTHTSAPTDSPMPSCSPWQTPGPPEQTPGPPEQTPHPTHGQRP